MGIAITPRFSPTWVEHGGMLAVASVRGGGEHGRSWYEAGRLARKQQSFDDFCACARWLASSGWSSPERIAIGGGSSGRLLVGACLTQHSELFGAAVASAGAPQRRQADDLFAVPWPKNHYAVPPSAMRSGRRPSDRL